MLQEKSYAKINLSLDVLGKREDGYHNLAMVMQTVTLSDEIQAKFTDSEQIKVKSNLSYLPTGEKNLASRAVRLFYKYFAEISDNQPILKGMDIQIAKKVPVCAGLAGGSGDGAAILRLLNTHHGLPFSTEKLSQMGQEIGADVPYCVMGGTALAEGTGEILTKLTPLPPCFIVLCKPTFSIATPELFQKIDSCRLKYRPDTKGLVDAVNHSDLNGIAQRMFNVFEEALHPRQQKVITEIKTELLDCGALGASMSGSGPTVLGLFTSREKAENAVTALQKDYNDTFFTKPISY